MICHNGTQLAGKHTSRTSITARGFFHMFYQWSRIGCSRTKNYNLKSYHSHLPRRVIPRQGCGHQRLIPTSQTRHSSSPPSKETHEAPLSLHMRTMMRSLPSTVVALTTTLATSTPPHRRYRGMTLSSFTTLTLAPSPIITFNVCSPSRTLDAISKSRHFLIHVLEATPAGARIADFFTKGNFGAQAGDVFREGTKQGLFEVEKELVSGEGKGWEGKVLALPRLRGSGVGRVLSCEVLGKLNPGGVIATEKFKSLESNKDDWEPCEGLVRVGDHCLVLGRVNEILEGYEDGKEGAEYGLSYADGKYRQAGKVIALDT